MPPAVPALLALSLLSAVAGCSGAGPAPAAAPLMVEPPAAPRQAKSCAAVVNLTIPQRADLLFGEKHLAVIVDLDAADEKPVVVTGVVVRGPGGLERLQRLNHFLAGGPFHDLGWSEWAAIGPGGTVTRVLSGQGFAAPLPVRKEDGPVQHHTHLDVSLTSAVGPYLSTQRQIYEFRENGFFDKPFHGGFEARRLETGKHVTWPAALLASVLKEVNDDLRGANADRAQKGEPSLGLLEAVDGQADFAFAFGAPGVGPIEGPPPSLTVLTSSCCDKDAIGRVKRATELPRPPGELAALLTPDPQEPGLWQAPSGCGSIGLRAGKLVKRRGQGAVERAFPGTVDRLVGLTWLGDGEVPVVKALPHRKPGADEHALLAHRLYATEQWDQARQEMREALKIEPKNPVWLRDLGRMLDRYSTSKQEEEASLREAAQLLEEALALATTKELRASILYRLGDLARHQGDRPRARELLARSLAELPTDAAKSALSSMPP